MSAHNALSPVASTAARAAVAATRALLREQVTEAMFSLVLHTNFMLHM